MFIPKGKIQPGYYKSEGSLKLENGMPYVGYYHKDVYGRYWSGKEHSMDSVKLLSYVNTKETESNRNLTSTTSNQYSNIRQSSYKSKPVTTITPFVKPVENHPTKDDYAQTYYSRFILEYRLSTKPVYVEVDFTTYKNVMGSKDKKFYRGVEVLWKLTGPLNDIKQGNLLVEAGVIDSNKRSIAEAEKQLPGVSNYLNNLTLYYQ